MTIKKIAFIVDGDAVLTISADTDQYKHTDGLFAGLMSNPEIIDVSHIEDFKGMFELYADLDVYK